jgi:hypothetical protein
VANKLFEGTGRGPTRPEECRAYSCDMPVWVISEGIVVSTSITFSAYDAAVGAMWSEIPTTEAAAF